MYCPRYTSPSVAAWAPAAAAQAAREQLTRLVDDALAATRLPHGALTVLATPRRLVTIVEQVAGRETDHVRLTRGPRLSAPFDPEGTPSAAASGFARAHGVAVGDLERADVNGVEHLVVRRHEPGRPVLEALSGALAGVLTGLRAANGSPTSAIAALGVTNLRADQAGPAELAALVRDHLGIEPLHWLRDTVYREDHSRARTHSQVMASMRIL